MFDETRLDDPQALASVDDDLREIAGWGAQVRLASGAADDALRTLPGRAGPRPRAVVAAGPDGRLLRTVLERVCPVPFVAWPHAGLPGWAGPLDLVVVVSARGAGSVDDEATVAQAVHRGCDLLVSCPVDSPLAATAAGAGLLLPAGSLDPLALSVPVLAALHEMGLGPQVGAEPVALALDDVAQRCGPGVTVDANPAKELALVLADHVPLVWGGSPLASRAARRVAEQMRTATGMPAVAGTVRQIEPLLASAPEHDIFADPFDDADDSASGAAPPALVFLDDGDPTSRDGQERLEDAARARDVRTHAVVADAGPDVARFATLLAVGRFTAAYLAVGRAVA